MKILFIENRYTTLIWAAVAQGLEKLGHEIHWIVQNPMFCPKIGNVHLLPFPTVAEKKQDDSFAWLSDLDRGVRWFGGDGSHWYPYSKKISQILQTIKPDVVFGEPTQFHELLTLEHARALGIPFLVPCVTRYPIGRVHFFQYDSLDPLGGEGRDLTDEDSENMLKSIMNHTIRPSYMELGQHSHLKKKWISITNKILIMTGWLRGERYITPSPWRKLLLEREYDCQFAQWESFAHRSLPASINCKTWVLYPFQMQPEVNIDLWGKPWSDQTLLVKRAAQALDRMDAVLVVKPNPRSKYELTAKLCELVEKTPNIIALSHNTPMKEVFPQTPLVMTVTGTVLLECIFSGKPVASIGNHSMVRYPGVMKLNIPEDIASCLENVMSQRISGASRKEAKRLLNFLYKTSYPAIFLELIDRPELMTEKSITALVETFEGVLLSISSQQVMNTNEPW